MNKKTTGIIAYITWIGWIVAFCAGDKEGQLHSLRRWYCWHYSVHFPVRMLAHGSDLCLPGAGEGSSPDWSDQDFKIIKMTISHKKNPRCSLHRGFFLWVRLAAHVSVIIKKL